MKIRSEKKLNRKSKTFINVMPKLGGSGIIKSNRYGTEYHYVRRSLDFNTNKSRNWFWGRKQQPNLARFKVTLSESVRSDKFHEDSR